MGYFLWPMLFIPRVLTVLSLFVGLFFASPVQALPVDSTDLERAALKDCKSKVGVVGLIKRVAAFPFQSKTRFFGTIIGGVAVVGALAAPVYPYDKGPSSPLLRFYLWQNDARSGRPPSTQDLLNAIERARTEGSLQNANPQERTFPQGVPAQ